MAAFEINLIRDRVIPAQRRKALFWGVSLYLAACIALLAFGANHATRRLLATQNLQREIERLDEQFRRVYPGERDILAFANRSEQQLSRHATQLEAIDAFMRQRLNLSGVLASLRAPLPEGVHLFNLDLELARRQRSLTFDVVLPAGPMESRVTGVRLANYWNTDEVLKSRAGRVRSVAAQRHRVQNQPVLILRFACAMDGQED